MAAQKQKKTTVKWKIYTTTEEKLKEKQNQNQNTLAERWDLPILLYNATKVRIDIVFKITIN